MEQDTEYRVNKQRLARRRDQARQCRERATANESPEQRELRLARRRKQARQCRQRATANETPERGELHVRLAKDK